MHTIRERARFWIRVEEAADGCWNWAGTRRENGYGSFAVKNPHTGKWTHTTSHRWSFVDGGGRIPDGFEVDHLCRNRSCVRPNHLEAVSVAENRRRRDIRYSPPVDRTLGLKPTVSLPPPPPRPERDLSRCRNGHKYAEVGWVKNGSNRTCGGCRSDGNMKRRKGGAHGTETHCPYGHEYSEANTYRRPSGGRECRICIRTRNRATRQRNARPPRR